jgi:hypothetical protein
VYDCWFAVVCVWIHAQHATLLPTEYSNSTHPLTIPYAGARCTATRWCKCSISHSRCRVFRAGSEDPITSSTAAGTNDDSDLEAGVAAVITAMRTSLASCLVAQREVCKNTVVFARYLLHGNSLRFVLAFVVMCLCDKKVCILSSFGPVLVFSPVAFDVDNVHGEGS